YNFFLILNCLFIVMTENIFKEVINHSTGQREWKVVNENNIDLAKEIAITGFGDMILDQNRNDLYEKGLIEVIKKKHKNNEEARVVDIGCGTGLLSLMAARAGADYVTAFEVFKPMADIARNILNLSEYKDKIHLVTSRSTDVNPNILGKLGNIIVAEVFDTELIGEGALKTFKEAHGNLVEKGSKVIPSSAKVYVVPFESSILRSFQTIKSNKTIKNPFSFCSGYQNVFDCQLSEMDISDLVILSEPVEVANFNFEDPDNIFYEEINYRRFTVSKEGQHRVDGFIFWWDIDMTGEGKIIISTVPKFIDKDRYVWRDHWMSAVYYPPQQLNVSEGDVVDFICAHDEYSFWFHLGISNIDAPTCDCGIHMLFSRNSIHRINSLYQNTKYMDCLYKNCERKDVVCLNEGSFIGLYAAQTARNVTIVEENSAFRKILEKFIEFNEIKNITLVSNLYYVQEFFDYVISEPFYLTAILPWEHFRYLYDLERLSSEYDIAPENLFIKKAELKCIPLYAENLWKIGAPVGTVNGFDLTGFDDVTQAARKATISIIEAHPLCEYTNIIAGDVTSLIEINMTDSLDEIKEWLSTSCFIPFSNSKCNVVAFWVDFILGDDYYIHTTGFENFKDSKNTIPSWCKSYKQGIYFVDLTNKDKIIKGINVDISMNEYGGLDFVIQEQFD
uniref:Protein arginine N-methyltransferase n=1 Tax=Strongyloides stercoralis TaxID=6248 RepID=A0AAF5I283_STRER